MNAGLNRPAFHRTSCELAPIVERDAVRRGAAFVDGSPPSRDHLGTVHRAIRLQPYTFARELIDHGENADRAAVRQLVADDVRRPALVRPTCLRLRNPLAARDLLPFYAADLQVLLVIKPVHSLCIDPSIPPAATAPSAGDSRSECGWPRPRAGAGAALPAVASDSYKARSSTAPAQDEPSAVLQVDMPLVPTAPAGIAGAASQLF
jgi:hypothetical protein